MFLSVTQGDIDAAYARLAIDLELRRERLDRGKMRIPLTTEEQERVYVAIHDCPISQALMRTLGLPRGVASAAPASLSISAHGDYKYSDTTDTLRCFMAVWDNHERAAPRRFRLEAFS